jgi:hypothetical protein
VDVSSSPQPQGGGRRRGTWWHILVALLAFLLWAHPGLVGLPFAALLFVAPPGDARRRWTFPLAGFSAALSAGLLVLTTGQGRLGAVTSAYVVLASAAFVVLVLLQPRSLLRMGVRAALIGMAATLVLVQVMWGSSGVGGLRWEAMRGASETMRVVVSIVPQWFGLYEPAVRFITLTWPLVLGLQALAGLALAWHLHLRAAGRREPAERDAQPGAPDVVRDPAPIPT